MIVTTGGKRFMETWDAIRARRNVRSYRPDPIPIVKPNRRPFNEVLHRGHW
ncbi:MAG: hypothetical protein JOZ58_11265 [Acetobacteraceae bacterium]|nr:hypothetical protein [Acetobacteraceae bacterium]